MASRWLPTMIKAAPAGGQGCYRLSSRRSAVGIDDAAVKYLHWPATRRLELASQAAAGGGALALDGPALLRTPQVDGRARGGPPPPPSRSFVGPGSSPLASAIF